MLVQYHHGISIISNRTTLSAQQFLPHDVVFIHPFILLYPAKHMKIEKENNTENKRSGRWSKKLCSSF